MAEFKNAISKTLFNEGNYSNDYDDPGGETYRGISRNFHGSWPGWIIIDKYKRKTGFPQILGEDVELQKTVEEFYEVGYWNPIKGDLIVNQTNANSVFDFAINSGLATSIRLVQSLVGTKIDGIIGEQTLKKINSMDFGHFQAAFTVAKIEYYMNIIRARPTNKKYLSGWITRALGFND